MLTRVRPCVKLHRYLTHGKGQELGIKKFICSNILRERKRKGLTQQELATLTGYTASYISTLERGSCIASLTVLEKLSKVLEVSIADLLAAPQAGPGVPADLTRTPILNDPSSDRLISPVKRDIARDGFLMPRVRSADSFALYLPDDSMAPEFGKGDLVTFSLSRKPTDGQACLVDTGKGQVLFRKVLAMGKGRWRLQPSNPKYQPVPDSGGKRLKMWLAVGHWRMLSPRRKA